MFCLPIELIIHPIDFPSTKVMLNVNLCNLSSMDLQTLAFYVQKQEILQYFG